MTRGREVTASHGDPEARSQVLTDGHQAVDEALTTEDVWRYPQMCDHWGVSRATVERWVRRFEATGEGIPVRRDPSGRPYWLAGEASAAAQPTPSATSRSAVLSTEADQLGRLRRAAARGRRS